jgi:hypothetical protein
MVVSDHARNMQILKDHTPKSIGDPPAELVMKLLAAVCHALVLNRNDLTGSRTTLRAFGFSAQASLADLQTSFGLTKIFWWRNLLAGREHGKLFQSQVDANLLREWDRLGDRDLTLDGDLVAASRAF